MKSWLKVYSARDQLLQKDIINIDKRQILGCKAQLLRNIHLEISDSLGESKVFTFHDLGQKVYI
ncbi:hypothetical protein HBNCFIEN_00763 [Legionella sp. PC997]|nr:hypothetical protein HBNCFIEN_00763 [Legionella sp. PC997]